MEKSGNHELFNPSQPATLLSYTPNTPNIVSEFPARNDEGHVVGRGAPVGPLELEHRHPGDDDADPQYGAQDRPQHIWWKKKAD